MGALRLYCLAWGLLFFQMEAAFSEEKDLTDKERHESQTFVNEALGNRIVREECAKLDDPKACQGRGEGGKFLGLDSGTVAMVAKAYALIMGGMYKEGLDGKVKEEETGEAEQKETGEAEQKETGEAEQKETGEAEQKETGEAEKKDDYCALIGAGAETVGTAMQQLSSKSIQSPSEGGTDQKKVLYKAARSHRDQAKTASVKAAGWGGASACYVYMMTHGGAALNSRKNIAKTAAAGLLAAFYFQESKHQKKYSRQVKEIAEKLPRPGDCNPITEVDCYCSLEEYQNNPDHCVPYLHKKKLSTGSILRVACTNNKLEADPQCQCAATDSCLDKKLKNDFVASGSGGGFMTSPVGKEAVSLMRGELASGSLTSSSMGKNAGLGAFFRNKGGKIPSVGALEPAKEKKASRLNEQFGLPLGLARQLVLAPAPRRLSAAMEQFRSNSGAGASGNLSTPKGNGKSRVLSFQGGGGAQGEKKKGRSSTASFDFNKYLKKGQKKKAPSKGNILEFNRRAINSAEVNKDGSKNIFHIISKRYMLWGGR